MFGAFWTSWHTVGTTTVLWILDSQYLNRSPVILGHNGLSSNSSNHRVPSNSGWRLWNQARFLGTPSMTKLSAQQMLSRARAHEKSGEFSEARKVYEAILADYPSNVRARKALDNLAGSRVKCPKPIGTAKARIGRTGLALSSRPTQRCHQ